MAKATEYTIELFDFGHSKTYGYATARWRALKDGQTIKTGPARRMEMSDARYHAMTAASTHAGHTMGIGAKTRDNGNGANRFQRYNLRKGAKLAKAA